MALTPERQALVDQVEARMDEITPADASPVASHTMISTHLEAVAADLARTIPREMAYAMAADASAFAMAGGEAIDVGGETVAALYPMPEGFLRFFRAQVVGWTRPVDHAVGVTSPAYRQAQNPFSGSTTSRPLAALVPYAGATANADSTALEVRPPPATISTGLEILFIATTTTATPETVPPGLIDALLWEAAGRTLAALRESGPAGDALQIAERARAAVKTGLVGEVD